MTTIIKGNHYTDQRGCIIFNNNFDATSVKRMYFIENKSFEIVRGWQGHKTENRWFTAVIGSFAINVVTIDNWHTPNPNLKLEEFILNSDQMDVLYVPNGNCTSIQASEPNSRLLAMSDYLLGEIQDEYRFPIDYFMK
jgi:dTDP-4-dehydrorhamnose 3,5-epimerase-like enzyme